MLLLHLFLLGPGSVRAAEFRYPVLVDGDEVLFRHQGPLGALAESARLFCAARSLGAECGSLLTASAALWRKHALAVCLLLFACC